MRQLDPETERPTNNLSKEAKMFCEKLGSDAATVIDVIGINISLICYLRKVNI